MLLIDDCMVSVVHTYANHMVINVEADKIIMAIVPIFFTFGSADL